MALPYPTAPAAAIRAPPRPLAPAGVRPYDRGPMSTDLDQGTADFGFAQVDRSRKPALVKGVFEAVAGRYDLMNDLMSAGAHRLWKDAAAARLNPQPGETIIDCAAGTGDMTLRLTRMADRARRRRGGGPARILPLDFSPAMIERGRRRRGGGDLPWTAADAQRLPLPDACADGYLIAFGLRNLTDPAGALVEARRVLRRGGRFLCLEFSRPTGAALRRAYDAYSFQVVPRLGALAARNRPAYAYLVESIRRFPDQAGLRRLMEEAGFSRVSSTNFSGGIVALHQGWAL